MGNIIRSILQRLGGNTAPRSPSPQAFMPSPGETPEPVFPRVAVIVFNPLLPGGQRLRERMGWNDPYPLLEAFIADLREASFGYVNYQMIEHVLVDTFPVKEDGFAYTGEGFLRAWQARSGFHQPDWADYPRLMAAYDLAGKVRRDEIDEVWLMGFPYAGFFESRMAGPGAFFINAPPLTGFEEVGRRFVIMGFSYERGVGEMHENFAHRAENTLERVHRQAGGENLWERFTRHERTHPGRAEVGTVHFAPNSRYDYDWGNMQPVLSRHHTWYRFPDLSGEAVWVDAREWGGGDLRLHHLWWLRHFPHVRGSSAGISHNWWEYVIDPNLV